MNLAINARDAIHAQKVDAETALLRHRHPEAAAAYLPSGTIYNRISFVLLLQDRAELPKESAAAFMTHFLPPRPWAGAPAWVWPRSMPSSKTTVAGLILRARWTGHDVPGLFSLWLPLAEGVERHASAAPSGGDETILLVEDEAALSRDLATEVLSRYGYRIFAAETVRGRFSFGRSTAPALKWCSPIRRCPAEANGRLCARRPGLKVLFTTGYSSELQGW